MLADLLQSAKKVPSVSLQVSLVGGIYSYRTVPVGTSMEPQVGGNACSGKENLCRGLSEMHIYLLLNVPARSSSRPPL